MKLGCKNQMAFNENIMRIIKFMQLFFFQERDTTRQHGGFAIYGHEVSRTTWHSTRT